MGAVHNDPTFRRGRALNATNSNTNWEERAVHGDSNRGRKAPRPPLASSLLGWVRFRAQNSSSPPCLHLINNIHQPPSNHLISFIHQKIIQNGQSRYGPHSLMSKEALGATLPFIPQSRRVRHCWRAEGFRAHLSGFPSRWMTRCHSTIP